MSNKGIIRGAEIDKPVPIPTLLQQDRGSVERVSNHGGAPIGDQIGFSDHDDVTELLKDGLILNKELEIEAFLGGGLGVEVDDVVVGRVVEGEERAAEHLAVAVGAGNEVGEARRRREGGDGEGMELGFDEGGGGEEGGGEDGVAVEREERGAVRGG